INLQLTDTNEARELFGTNDLFLKRIEAELEVTITSRGEEVHVAGEQTPLVEKILTSMLQIIQTGQVLTERDVMYAIQLAKENKLHQFETLFEDEIMKNAQGK